MNTFCWEKTNKFPKSYYRSYDEDNLEKYIKDFRKHYTDIYLYHACRPI